MLVDFISLRYADWERLWWEWGMPIYLRWGLELEVTPLRLIKYAEVCTARHPTTQRGTTRRQNTNVIDTIAIDCNA